jgi:trehalose 6-phosphate phosphatase
MLVAKPPLLAAVFDLDGVVTFTARVHAAAWKELFDHYLRSSKAGKEFQRFTMDDYHRYVDGRPRYDGVQTFLRSRGIELPHGKPSDPSGAETVCGLGNHKDELFRAKLQQMGVETDFAAVRLIRALRSSGVHVGVASSSKNTTLVLERVKLTDLFEAQVDGVVSERLGLKGKPHPDIFLTCLELLGADDAFPAMVVEDAVAGVEAGRAGGFGLVLGVDRGGNAEPLRRNGADWVIDDFAKLSVRDVFRVYRSVSRQKQKLAG